MFILKRINLIKLKTATVYLYMNKKKKSNKTYSNAKNNALVPLIKNTVK